MPSSIQEIQRMKKTFLLSLLFLGSISLFFIPHGVFADITNTSFDINVSTFTPGWYSLIGWNSEATVDNVLSAILMKIIVIFWVCSALIMTIGAGYMIIYHGQDEFLSKGKSIFTAGIIALVVALSAGIIVRLFAYLLYS